MVQWRTEGGGCRKCGKDLSAPAAVMEAPADVPTPKAPQRFPIRLVVGLAVTIVVALVAWVVGRHIMDARGTPVGHFEDSTELVVMDFPKGWYHLDVERRDLPMPRFASDRFWNSIRGSFFLGKSADPYAVFYLRVDILGMSMGPAQRVGKGDRAEMLHSFGDSEMQRLGGTYSPLVPPDAGGKAFSREEINRFNWMRVDGRITTSEPLFLWHGGGEYRMITLYASGSARDYWIHIFCPERYYSRAWPRIRALIDGANFSTRTV
jgi:hypothetical protein